MSAISIVILISILVVIAIGYFTKINFGLLGISFAFLLGCLFADMSPNTVLGQWPAKLFFQMFTVTFFYAFAINNGTLELFARKLVYMTRKVPFLIPVILWLSSAILAGIGPGSVAMFLVLSPIIMKVAKESEMHLGLATIVLATGANAGAWSPIAVNGITTAGLIETTGFTAAEAAQYAAVVWRNMVVASVIIFVIGYFVFRGFKIKPLHSMERPAAFNSKQKTTIVLIVIMTALLIIPALLKGIGLSGGIKWFAGKMEVTFLAIVFSVIAVLCKIGDEKEAMANVPWKTIVMVCGMGMLIGVASESGALAYLSGYITDRFSPAIIPLVVCLVAGVMSVFSSTMGVVVPTLYPIVFAISMASGSSPAMLFSVIPIAAGYSGMSPFSLQGGLALSAAEESKREKMFILLIAMAVIAILLVALFVAIGIIRS